MKVAYVIYPDFTALDIVGPYEVISRWPDVEVDVAVALTERVHGQELARALQLVIEYDPKPPFDSGSPSKADRPTQRLADQVLLAGQSRPRVMARAAKTIMKARRRRARRSRPAAELQRAE